MRVLPSFSASSFAADPAIGLASQAAGPWEQAWAQPAFRRSGAGVAAVLLGGVVPVVGPFFHYIQQRPGPVLADPLLALLPRHDEAGLIFLLMYGSVLLGLGWLARRPLLLLRGLWGLVLLLVLRMLVIWLVPLSPPTALIPMPDPFTAHLFQTAGSEVITKDLFFSGHTATVTLLAMAVRGRWRILLAGLAGLVGLLVLVQRVHYSYDVLAAPAFTWLAYHLAGRLTAAVPSATASPVPVLAELVEQAA